MPDYTQGGINTGSGIQQLPIYDVADFGTQQRFVRGWNPAWGQQPEGGGWYNYSGMGDSPTQSLREGAAYDPNYSGGPDGSPEMGYMEDFYGMNLSYDDAKAKYGELFAGGNSNNWEFKYGNDPTKFNARMKTGEKVGTNFEYSLQDGKFVPRATGQERWDTNNGRQNMDMLKVALTAVGMGMAGPALTGLGNNLAAGALPTLGQAGAGLNLANTVTGGQLPGLREASMVTSLGGSLGNAANLATNGVNTLEDIAKLGQTGYNVYSKGSNLMDTFTGGNSPPPRTPQVGNTGTGVYANGMPGESNFDLASIIRGITGGAGGGQTGLLGLYGAYRGSQEARDEAQRLQGLYTDAQGRRQPVLDRLNESYTNPNSFYDSNQWKGLSSVYQNSIDRNAAKTGRMANPTDREVLMQNHAMKGMEDYRTGLRGQLTALNPDAYINPFMRGSTREAGSFNPIAALGGRGGVGGPGQQGGASGLEQIINLISRGGQGAAGGVQQLIRMLGGGGGYNPGAQAPGTEYVGSDEVPVGGLEPQYGEPQISYGNDIPGMDYGNVMSGGGFNPGGFNVDLGGANNFGYDFGDSGFDVNDMSWINGFDFNLP